MQKFWYSEDATDDVTVSLRLQLCVYFSSLVQPFLKQCWCDKPLISLYEDLSGSIKAQRKIGIKHEVIWLVN